MFVVVIGKGIYWKEGMGEFGGNREERSRKYNKCFLVRMVWCGFFFIVKEFCVLCYLFKIGVLVEVLC